MWYHYLLVLAGLYLVGSAIYSLVIGPRSVTSMAMNGVQLAIGGGLVYYGYTGIMTPAVPTMISPAVNTMMGGLRRILKKH